MIRVSSPGQATDDKMGLKRQRKDIDAFCEIYNLKVVREFEIVMSGTDVQRTRAFHEMLSMLKQPEIAGIVVASLDRLFRVTKLSVLAVFKDFEDTGKFLFCDLGEMDLNNPNHMMMVSIKAQMAGMEKNLIRYRTLEARNEKRLDPLACVDRLPGGVEHERERDKVNRGRFRYTDYAYEKVKPAFERFSSGETLISIAEDLGFRSQAALRYVLQNKWWIGIKTRNHKVVGQSWNPDTEQWTGGKRVTHDDPRDIKTNLVSSPLVSIEVFERVQALLTQNRSTWTQKRSRLDEFLGAGLLYCRCGAKMYHYKSINGRMSTYVCARRYRGMGPCDQPRVSAKAVDGEIVLQIVLHMTDEPFIQARIRESLDEESTAEKERAVEHAAKAVAQLRKEERKLAEAVRKASDLDILIEKLRQVKQELLDAENRSRLASEDLALSLSDNDVRAMSDMLRQEFANFPQMNRSEQKIVLARDIQRITVWHDEFAGIVLDFKVKVGVPEPQYQRTSYPVEPPTPGKPKAVVDERPIRVLSPDGNKWEKRSTSSSSMPAEATAPQRMRCVR